MADNAESTGSRKLVITKFVLAGVAIVGVGAALTSAAWTDDVWFTADASAGTMDLQGRVQGDADWQDVGIDAADDDASDDVVIEIDPALFGGIVPGFDETVTLELKNAGDTNIVLSLPVVVSTGDLFVANGTTLTVPATVEVSDPTVLTLEPLDETTFTVNVSTPDDWPEAYVGATGNIEIQVVGTAS